MEQGSRRPEQPARTGVRSAWVARSPSGGRPAGRHTLRGPPEGRSGLNCSGHQ